MYQQQYSFTLESITPLIMHWDNIEWTDQISEERSVIKEKDKKAFSAGDDRCPPHTWKGCVYNDGKHVTIPTDNLMACIMKAGAKIELKGKQTYKSLTQSAILFDGTDWPLLLNGKPLAFSAIEKIKGKFKEQAEAAQALGFHLFMKRAAIGQTKHVRVRPRFDEWKVAGSFTVVDEQVIDEKLDKLFNIAGLYIGLGDWRPGSKQSPGPYGRFRSAIKAI